MNLTIKLYYIGKYRKQNIQDQQGIHVRFRNTLPSQYKNTFSIFHECSSLAGANSYQFHSDFQLDQITIPNDLVLHRHLRYFLPIFYIIFLFCIHYYLYIYTFTHHDAYDLIYGIPHHETKNYRCLKL